VSVPILYEPHRIENIVLSKVTSPAYSVFETLNNLHEDFLATGCVVLEQFLTPSIMQCLDDELALLYKTRSVKHFMMPGYNTPRFLSVSGGSKILSESSVISSLYIHYELNSVLSRIIGSDIFTIQHREECIVANYLDEPGATHGWHLDDPMYALIIVLEDWRRFCHDLDIDPIRDVARGVSQAEDSGLIFRFRPGVGDCYVLRAGETLHRVSPLLDPGSKRKVINMAFDSRHDIRFGATADMLYAEDQASLRSHT
jgi:hypothetical protein